MDRLYKGDTYTRVITLKDLNRQLIDFTATAWTFSHTIRDADQEAIATGAAAIDSQTATQVLFTMTADQTSALDVGCYIALVKLESEALTRTVPFEFEVFLGVE